MANKNNIHDQNWIDNLEKYFKVESNKMTRATYTTLVNYSTDLEKRFQRWYRYKEGFSVTLIERILEEENVQEGEFIVDPFLGSGSTLIAAKGKGINGFGYEINPFVADLAEVKLNDYSISDTKLFETIINRIEANEIDTNSFKKPQLSIFDKLFESDTGEYLLKLIEDTKKYHKNKKVEKLYKIAVLSIAEELSNYRKAGNGLKIRRAKKFIPANTVDAKNSLIKKLRIISKDLNFANNSENKTKQVILNKSSLKGLDEIENNLLSGSIFSPPYANCFDYTEIYKIELWLGKYVKDYSELKPIRKQSVRSHLNAFSKDHRSTLFRNNYLDSLISELSSRTLWDKKIPKMIEYYLDDLNKLLLSQFEKLKNGGFCKIIVSNSAYGGLIVPTDLLISSFAEQIGYKVEKIEIVRYIITSSQQYKQTDSNKKYLRESIIHLRK